MLSPILMALAFPEVDKAKSDFALFLYDLMESSDQKRLSLKLQRIIYTTFESALELIAHYEAGPIGKFTEVLQRKLDAKRSGTANIDTENIVIE